MRETLEKFYSELCKLKEISTCEEVRTRYEEESREEEYGFWMDMSGGCGGSSVRTITETVPVDYLYTGKNEFLYIDEVYKLIKTGQFNSLESTLNLKSVLKDIQNAQVILKKYQFPIRGQKSASEQESALSDVTGKISFLISQIRQVKNEYEVECQKFISFKKNKTYKKWQLLEQGNLPIIQELARAVSLIDKIYGFEGHRGEPRSYTYPESVYYSESTPGLISKCRQKLYEFKQIEKDEESKHCRTIIATSSIASSSSNSSRSSGLASKNHCQSNEDDDIDISKAIYSLFNTIRQTGATLKISEKKAIDPEGQIKYIEREAKLG